MKKLIILLIVVIGGCTYRKPMEHEPIVGIYHLSERAKIVNALADVIAERDIGIASKDAEKGFVITDSFDVLPEYCDCGKNFLGAEYPGIRHGVMRITVAGSKEVNVNFDFKTRLRITGNNMKILCRSRGVLEKKLLREVEKKMGISEVEQ